MSIPALNIYILSDNHFLHGKIIEHCNRPFKDQNDQDTRMKTLWNATVREQDMVIHLGDLSFTAGSSELIKQRLKELNGRIILVRGNHDRKSTMWYLTNGIDFICDRFVWEYNNKRMLFVHNPAHVSPDEYKKYQYVLHGHCHGNVPFITKRDDCTFINLSVEHLKYTPLSLLTLLNRLTQGYYEQKR